MRVGHHHDLPVVGRIRRNLLIARHAGVEAKLASCLAGMTKALAGHNRAVFKSHFGGWEGGGAVTNEVHTQPRVHALMDLTEGHKKTLPIPPARRIKSRSYGRVRLTG